MSVKPENRYIGSIHKLLPVPVYYEKMCNPYRSGTPDVWYSGSLGDLWVEYKYIPSIPKRTVVLPDLSDRQKRWLGNRLDEGRNVAVVLGTPKGGVIYRQRSWLEPLDPEGLSANLVPNRQIAVWIVSQVGESRCHTTQ